MHYQDLLRAPLHQDIVMLINYGHLLPVLTFPQTMSLLFGHWMNTLLSWPLVNGRYWVSLPEMAGSCDKRVKNRKHEKSISKENALKTSTIHSTERNGAL